MDMFKFATLCLFVQDLEDMMFPKDLDSSRQVKNFNKTTSFQVSKHVSTESSVKPGFH